MRLPRVLAPLVLAGPLLAGCAAWRPSLTDASQLARDVACTVCQATGGPSEQADRLSDALRILAEAMGRSAANQAEAERVLEQLARGQEEQRTRFRRLEALTEPR